MQCGITKTFLILLGFLMQLWSDDSVANNFILNNVCYSCTCLQHPARFDNCCLVCLSVLSQSLGFNSGEFLN